MSGITDPIERYFKDGLWGWDGTRWQQLLVDAAGNLRITMDLPVVARCKTGAGQSIPNAVMTIVDFGTVVEDTHGKVTTGAAWKFTAPVAGLYHVDVRVMFSTTTTWADGENGKSALYLNGIESIDLDRKDNYGSASSVYMKLSSSVAVRMVVGDYIDFRIFQNSGAALDLYYSSLHNALEIFRVCA